MSTRRQAGPRLRHRVERIELPPRGALRVAVLADTHGSPHHALEPLLHREEPGLILHAGDVGGRSGGLDLLGRLEGLCPVLAVRGNVDSRATRLHDVITLELIRGGELALTVLLLHVAIARTRLQARARELARLRGASLVVFGHSHVPFLGRDAGVALFNPGSCGPRRFDLPITFGRIDVTTDGVDLWHIDCETGAPWLP